MKLGDIKGEFSPSRQVDRDPGDNFHGNAAGDPLPTEEIIRNHGNRTNWDAICDIGTSIKQTSVADALTNYRPEGFSEVEIHFVRSVDNDHDPAAQFNQGVVAAGVFSELDQGFVAADPFSELDQGFSTENLDARLRSDNRFVFEPLNAMTSFGDSLDPGLDGANGFKPREVAAVEIGRPPDPKLWLHTLGPTTLTSNANP